MKFEECIIKSYPTGSRYICNPPPTDTDNDTVILINGYYDWENILLDDGWEDCGKEYASHSECQFKAFRKGEENYIVTEEPDFYLSYVKATEGAKALNLFKKEDRIALFDAINSTTMEGYCSSGPQTNWNFADGPDPLAAKYLNLGLAALNLGIAEAFNQEIRKHFKQEPPFE